VPWSGPKSRLQIHHNACVYRVRKGLAFPGNRDQIQVMANKGNTRIARDARLTAEADFATWLMMAKLGSFDDLPKDAQAFLSQYRERLKTTPEKDAAATTVDEIYAAYYAKRGGKGDPPPVTDPAPSPEPAPTTSNDNNVVRLQDARRAREARAAAPAAGPKSQRRMPVLLIFIGLVAIVVAIKFLMGGINP
jgi:hypothetical protein